MEGYTVESVGIAGFASIEELKKHIHEKMDTLEQIQDNPDKHTAIEINSKIKELKQLQKTLEDYHLSIQKANEEKQNAIDELSKKTKEIKRLQAAIEEQHTIKEQGAKNEGKKRNHKEYKLSINHAALKQQEGIPKSSFLALAKEVILIDSKPYDEKYLTLSKERKNDFKRLIEHFALLEVIGKRKYNIKRVYSIEQREELNEQQTNIQRNNSKK